jgi:hypothetical protein
VDKLNKKLLELLDKTYKYEYGATGLLYIYDDNNLIATIEIEPEYTKLVNDIINMLERYKFISKKSK